MVGVLNLENIRNLMGLLFFLTIKVELENRMFTQPLAKQIIFC
jgi:hypothetical protein